MKRFAIGAAVAVLLLGAHTSTASAAGPRSHDPQLRRQIAAVKRAAAAQVRLVNADAQRRLALGANPALIQAAAALRTQEIRTRAAAQIRALKAARRGSGGAPATLNLNNLAGL